LENEASLRVAQATHLAIDLGSIRASQSGSEITHVQNFTFEILETEIEGLYENFLVEFKIKTVTGVEIVMMGIIQRGLE
jgi:hypothetical protein